VACYGRDAAALNETARLVRAMGVESSVFVGDAQSNPSLEDFVRHAVATHGEWPPARWRPSMACRCCPAPRRPAWPNCRPSSPSSARDPQCGVMLKAVAGGEELGFRAVTGARPV
jgi:hypothetical protein